MSLVVTLHDGLSLVLPGAAGGTDRGAADRGGAGHTAAEGEGAPRHVPDGAPPEGLSAVRRSPGPCRGRRGVRRAGAQVRRAGGLRRRRATSRRVTKAPCARSRAVYRMDLVERLAGAGGETVAPRPLYAAKDALAALHRRVPAVRGFLTATSTALRRRFGWETVYVPVGLKAEVPVTSAVDRRDGSVRVEVDLTGLPGDVTEVAVMNEQGARAFDRFEDSGGAVLHGDAIGTWDEVTAAGARFVSPAYRVAFSIEPGRWGGAAPRPRAGRRPPRLGRVRAHGAREARAACATNCASGGHRELRPPHLPVLPPACGPLAVPLSPSGSPLRGRRRTRRGSRRARAGLHVSAARGGRAPRACRARRRRRHLLPVDTRG